MVVGNFRNQPVRRTERTEGATMRPVHAGRAPAGGPHGSKATGSSRTGPHADMRNAARCMPVGPPPEHPTAVKPQGPAGQVHTPICATSCWWNAPQPHLLPTCSAASFAAHAPQPHLLPTCSAASFAAPIGSVRFIREPSGSCDAPVGTRSTRGVICPTGAGV